MAHAVVFGSRLAYVVVPLSGKVKRPHHKIEPGTGIVEKMEEEPAGFMVYFPRGHAIRVKDRAQLKHYRLDRPPTIINLQGLNDPNSPVGRVMNAQDQASREGAMENLRQQVIRLACAKSGTVLMPEQVRAAPSGQAA